MIIVDGTDRTGKSTILYEFSKLTRIPRLHWDGVRNSGIKDLHDPVLAVTSKLSVEMTVAFLELMHEKGFSNAANFISDRGYMSELAYSEFFHRKCLINQRRVEEKLRNLNCVFVFLHCDEDELRERFIKTGDMYVTVDEALHIQDIYERLFQMSTMLKMQIEVAEKTPLIIAKEIAHNLNLDIGR